MGAGDEHQLPGVGGRQPPSAVASSGRPVSGSNRQSTSGRSRDIRMGNPAPATPLTVSRAVTRQHDQP
jgi:hypothetical protein